MTSHTSAGILAGLGALCLTLALGAEHLATPDGSQSAPAADRPLVAAEHEGEPGQEGITVHGRWRIQVRDPDGTVVSTTDFNNALHTEGSETLARLLGRVGSVGEWQIALQDLPGNQPCDASGTPVQCRIVESGTQVNEFPTLTLSVAPLGDPDGDKLILSGTATAGRNGQITTVQTRVDRPCLEGSGAPECGPGAHVMTSTGIAAIPVQAGQSILATVALSFS